MGVRGKRHMAEKHWPIHDLHDLDYRERQMDRETSYLQGRDKRLRVRDTSRHKAKRSLQERTEGRGT